MPGSYNFSVYQGDTKEFTAALSSGPPPSGPFVPINLTGCTVAAQIRDTPVAAVPAATITCTVTDAANGLVLLSMAPAVTAALGVGTKVWDMEVLFPSGKKFTYLKGNVTIEAEVTRS